MIVEPLPASGMAYRRDGCIQAVALAMAVTTATSCRLARRRHPRPAPRQGTGVGHNAAFRQWVPVWSRRGGAVARQRRGPNGRAGPVYLRSLPRQLRTGRSARHGRRSAIPIGHTTIILRRRLPGKAADKEKTGPGAGGIGWKRGMPERNGSRRRNVAFATRGRQSDAASTSTVRGRGGLHIPT